MNAMISASDLGNIPWCQTICKRKYVHIHNYIYICDRPCRKGPSRANSIIDL